jgi:hypothetical protein
MSKFQIETKIDRDTTVSSQPSSYVIETLNAVDGYPTAGEQTCTHFHNDEFISSLGRDLYEIIEETAQRSETQYRL